MATQRLTKHNAAMVEAAVGLLKTRGADALLVLLEGSTDWKRISEMIDPSDKPVIVAVDAADRDVYMREMFGPVIFVVATDSTEQSLSLATESARENGAITWLVYTTEEAVMADAIDAAVDGGVSVAFNLTGGLFVNQSAAFSDFHVTGANPAGNASLTDPAFVAGRFRVIGVRMQ